MDADGVLVAESLADGIDGGEPDVRGVERVDTHVRLAARVGGPADVAHGLDDAAVVRRRHPGPTVLRPRGRVDHHGQVHVVEVAETHELGLAPEELELARAGLIHPPLDVAVLLGGHGEKHNTSREMIGRVGVEQPHGGAEEAGHLGVVTARVGRPRLAIGEGMAGHD